LKIVKICLLAAVVCALLIGALAHQAQLAGSAGGQPVGLSLFFRDGAAQPITLVGDAPRYLQEIDIIATVATQGDQGIEPLIENSEFASLDWPGARTTRQWRSKVTGASESLRRF
jgi:hypothetical protein